MPSGKTASYTGKLKILAGPDALLHLIERITRRKGDYRKLSQPVRAFPPLKAHRVPCSGQFPRRAACPWGVRLLYAQ